MANGGSQNIATITYVDKCTGNSSSSLILVIYEGNKRLHGYRSIRTIGIRVQVSILKKRLPVDNLSTKTTQQQEHHSSGYDGCITFSPESSLMHQKL